MNDYPFGYLGLKTEACQRKKKSLFVIGTLKNNSTPAGDFTGYYVSWVAPLWELACSPQLGYTGHSVLLILGCVCVCVCVCVLSHFSLVRLFATAWTVALQAPLSMGFSRKEYWNGLPCPPPGDLPNLGAKP